MGFYDDHVLPHLINLSMRNRLLLPYRQRIVSQAEGRVLEVGIGSALNIPYYGTPLWKKVGGGCHLNRPIATLVEGAGFTIADLKTGYMRGPKPMTFMYEGRAQRT